MEMKRQAVQYYNENQVPKQLESLLNAMFLERPQDLYGYMSNFFGKLSKPVTLNEVRCLPCISSSGYESLQAHVYCTVKGEKKLSNQMQLIAGNRPFKERITLKTSTMKPGSSKKDSKNKLHAKKDTHQTDVAPSPASKKSHSQISVKNLTSLIEVELIPLLENQIVEDQLVIDKKLNDRTNELQQIFQQRMQEPRPSTNIPTVNEISEGEDQSKDERNAEEVSFEHSLPQEDLDTYRSELLLASLFTSLLLGHTAASTLGIPLYQSLRKVYNSPEPSFSIPVPAMSVLCSDLSSYGKLNMFRDVLILPKLNEDFHSNTLLLPRLSHCIDGALHQKFGANLLRSDHGAPIAPFDKPEQVFELLNTVTQQSLEAEFYNLFDVIIDVGADEIFDMEKKKYEVCMGSQKSSMELIAIYKHWIGMYPIVGIIDGVSAKDEDAQNLLYTELSRYCFIISSGGVDQEGMMKCLSEGYANSFVLQPERFCSTVTAIHDVVHVINKNGGEVMVTDECCSAQSIPYTVDMATCFGCHFMRMSNPSAWGSFSFNRWLDVYNELREGDMLKVMESHGFVSQTEEKEEETEESQGFSGDQDK